MKTLNDKELLIVTGGNGVLDALSGAFNSACDFVGDHMVKPCDETMRDVTNSAVRTVGEGLGFDEFVKKAMNQDSFPSLNLTNRNMLK